MATAYSDELNMEHAHQDLFSLVMRKPVTVSVLNDALLSVLSEEKSEERFVSTCDLDMELAKRQGSRILMAEDNVVNQDVTAQLLRDVGMDVTIAGDGMQALNLFKSESFDLIIMDVQMPELDGLEATRRIRELEAALRKNSKEQPGASISNQTAQTNVHTQKGINILAMTANAFGEDREICLEAGMNDHIPKPVDPLVLYKTLVLYLKPRHTVEDLTHVSDKICCNLTMNTPEPDVPDSLRNIQGLDVDAGLRTVRCKPERYLSMLRQFLENHKHDAEKMNADFAEDNIEELQHNAHALKGLAANMGARDLSLGAGELEAVCKHQKTHRISEALDFVSDTLSRLIADLSEFFAELKSSTAQKDENVEVDYVRIRSVLEQLEEMLDNNDTGAGELCDAEKLMLQAAFGETAKDLVRKVHDFDYDEAIEVLGTMKDSL